MADHLGHLPPVLKPPAEGEDKDVYGHLSGLKDAVTMEAPTHATTIVGLHQHQGASRLLKNLTAVSQPKVLCQLVDSDGRVWGPSSEHDFHYYRLEMSFNRLLLAPALRLECVFLKDSNIYLRIGIDFHFTRDTGVQSYKRSVDNAISFTSNGGVSVYGFNHLEHARTQTDFGDEEHEIVSLLSSYITPASRHSVQLIIHDGHLSALEKSDLADIHARLPGGSGSTLLSFGKTEYSCFGEIEAQNKERYNGTLRLTRPLALMSTAPRHPMVALQSSDTFRSVREAVVELSHSTHSTYAEEKAGLELWSSTTHTGRIFRRDGNVIIGLKFGDFHTLGYTKRKCRYRLPKDLSSKLTFQVPGGDDRAARTFVGFLLTNTAGLPKSQDAYFQITSEKGFRTADTSKTFGVQCDPHFPNFMYNSHMNTAMKLESEEATEWHDVLLNQNHAVLQPHDLTSYHGISEEVKAAAYKWLLAWKPWNSEQLSVIRGLQTAKGRLVLVMGAAGTGKTLLQTALAIYFFKLGFHVLALGPANSDANSIAQELSNANETTSELADLDFLRLYPSSKKAGHEGGNVLPFSEFLQAVDDQGHSDSCQYNIVHAVIAAATDGKLKLHGPLLTEGKSTWNNNRDAWDVLREFMVKYKNQELDNGANTLYYDAYIACKGHLVGLSRLMITTTGNVLASEMMDHWASEETVYGVPCRGVMVLVDEASKDLEINVWAGIVGGNWASKVQGVLLFGDDKQLKPSNTSSIGVVFNAFGERLNIALPTRLVREGYPHHRLLEQRRMHSAIADFPNRSIYQGQLRNGPGMDAPLEQCLPGFRNVLCDILLQSTSLTDLEREHYRDPSADSKLRLHWIQVYGVRVKEPTGSSNVAEHVNVFFTKIYPMLRKYFDETKQKMEDYIMIICAYSGAVRAYEEGIYAMQSRDPRLQKEDMPRVLTVDASQGKSSPMVILDGSFQFADGVGFMDDIGRANVAITRASEVFWVIGGKMTFRDFERAQHPLAHYKLEMNAEHCHVFKADGGYNHESISHGSRGRGSVRGRGFGRGRGGHRGSGHDRGRGAHGGSIRSMPVWEAPGDI